MTSNPASSASSAPSAPRLSEADIQAYADGTLAPERAASLRDYLTQDPAEARRVAFYGKLNARIQQAFQTTGESADRRAHGRADSGAHGLRHVARRWRLAARRNRPLGVAASCALVLLALTGWLAATQVSVQALDNAAVMALAENAAAPFPAATPTRDDGFAPNLSAIGLRLVEQRSLSLGPFQRASEFIYLNADNRPVVVISAWALLAPAQPQWAARRIGEIRLLTWHARSQRFVVAGDARTHGLMRAADAMTLQ
ncbi:anti-sigma factor family protein [Paraburkholderia sp. BCC1886]|uniref:anti-sigma factor family protein n=1 Tax=Paraburkholderia sp. BCC1886 TaxID=2562670 RepID=UPI0011824057|nr:transcriptional regulator [Paraburkholderia sp. BCC1886]